MIAQTFLSNRRSILRHKFAAMYWMQEISIPSNQSASVGAVLASKDLIFERIARCAIWLHAIVAGNIFRDDRIAVLPLHFDALQEFDLCKVLHIKRERQHLITKEHVDDRQVEQHLEI